VAARVAAGDGPDVQEVELTAVRRTIAKRLVQSKGPIPHFYLTVEVAMDRVWDAYKALRDQKSTISVNDIIVKATALALRQHPDINASFGGDHIRQFTRVHIGMAVALDDGLITPVLRDADLKPLEEISEEARTLVDRARARKLQPGEYTGATFSISNLGMMGIEEFSAIINPPEAAILAVGAVRQVPVVVDGQLAVGYRMKMTLSVDHRVADGAGGARFLQTLKRFLEHPLLMA
jgi:pyruvate dehydrogenase E2 component (dihydrolipoamide acetyltransferase)